MDGELHKKLATRQTDFVGTVTVEELQGKIAVEQFLSFLPDEMWTWVQEKKSATGKMVGRLADEFVENSRPSLGKRTTCCTRPAEQDTSRRTAEKAQCGLRICPIISRKNH